MSTEQRSKKLSYLLRHSPEAANLTLDSEGWCSLPQLLYNTDFSVPELQKIVREDSKGRYTLEADRIRANQGHSVGDVKISFTKKIPPTVLYHGTMERLADKILTEGLLPMGRHHVHLASDLETARQVATRRKGQPIIFEIDTKAMVANGITFFISDNNVWLVDRVDPKYIQELK